jgi:excisionase family DNA binding protein
MQNRRTIEKIFADSETTGPKTLTMGAPQFPPFSANRLFTAAEAGAYLKVEPRTLCKFITGEREHKLKASFVGRQWLISEAALLDFVSAQQTSPEIQ